MQLNEYTDFRNSLLLNYYIQLPYLYIMSARASIILNNNDGSSLIGYGEIDRLRIEKDSCIKQLQRFIDTHSGKHMFVCLSYDIKNEIEDLESSNEDGVGFPRLIVWVPKQVVEIHNDEHRYVFGGRSSECEELIARIKKGPKHPKSILPRFYISSKTSMEEYLEHVKQLKNELQIGNIYEVNYCQEFFSQTAQLSDPLEMYFHLNEFTQAPYSAYVNFDEFTVISGSPECYLSKRGNRLKSFPIKGTKRRSGDPVMDARLKEDLKRDEKERSENIMIVDLVRNDLSRIAKVNSVEVDELCEVYTFPTVHQMISTISCEVKESLNFEDILRATFPMGSMTGAPKISAMQLIEKHENFQRGIYSGSIGHIKPDGDFDLNVVIRTIVHNALTNYLSCSVGSAITIKSDPELEYEECMVKVKGILEYVHGRFEDSY